MRDTGNRCAQAHGGRRLKIHPFFSLFNIMSRIDNLILKNHVLMTLKKSTRVISIVDLM
jgi:hypothetical protein